MTQGILSIFSPGIKPGPVSLVLLIIEHPRKIIEKVNDLSWYILRGKAMTGNQP